MFKELVEQSILKALEESASDHKAMAAKHAAHENMHANETDRHYYNGSHDDSDDHGEATVNHESAKNAHNDAHAALKKHGADSTQYKSAADKAHKASKEAIDHAKHIVKPSARYAVDKKHHF